MHVYLVNLDEGAKERLPIYTKENVEVRDYFVPMCFPRSIIAALEQTRGGEQLEQQHLVQDGVVGGQSGAPLPV